jgi:hypothetical protein
VLLRFVTWLAGGVVLALAGWGAVAAAQKALEHVGSRPPPPVRVQLTRFIEHSVRTGWTVSSQRLDFPGVGGPSYVVVLAPDFKASLDGRRAKLEILNERRGRLVKALTFTPIRQGSSRPLVAPLDLSIAWAGPASGSGTNEVVLAIEDRYGRVSYPVVIYWNVRVNGFRIVPILSPAGYYHDDKMGIDPPKGARPVRFTSPGWARTITTYASVAFLVRRFEDRTVLVAAHRLSDSDSGSGKMELGPSGLDNPYELDVWILTADSTDPRFPAWPCLISTSISVPRPFFDEVGGALRQAAPRAIGAAFSVC